MTEEITVLLVDDEPLPRKTLRRAFEVADAPEFKFRVLDAANVAEYQKIVHTTHVDVLVIDLRLNEAEEGTDDVVSFHHVHSPDTIIIAFTGFPGESAMSSLKSCVRVMRAGAVDCIAKAQTDDNGNPDGVRSVVGRSIEELRLRRSPESGPTPEWLERELPELVKKYAGMAVAIRGQTVIASAPTVQELRRVIAQLGTTVIPYLMVIPKWSPE